MQPYELNLGAADGARAQVPQRGLAWHQSLGPPSSTRPPPRLPSSTVPGGMFYRSIVNLGYDSGPDLNSSQQPIASRSSPCGAFPPHTVTSTDRRTSLGAADYIAQGGGLGAGGSYERTEWANPYSSECGGGNGPAAAIPMTQPGASPTNASAPAAAWEECCAVEASEPPESAPSLPLEGVQPTRPMSTAPLQHAPRQYRRIAPADTSARPMIESPFAMPVFGVGAAAAAAPSRIKDEQQSYYLHPQHHHHEQPQQPQHRALRILPPTSGRNSGYGHFTGNSLQLLPCSRSARGAEAADEDFEALQPSPEQKPQLQLLQPPAAWPQDLDPTATAYLEAPRSTRWGQQRISSGNTLPPSYHARYMPYPAAAAEAAAVAGRYHQAAAVQSPSIAIEEYAQQPQQSRLNATCWSHQQQPPGAGRAVSKGKFSYGSEQFVPYLDQELRRRQAAIPSAQAPEDMPVTEPPPGAEGVGEGEVPAREPRRLSKGRGAALAAAAAAAAVVGDRSQAWGFDTAEPSGDSQSCSGSGNVSNGNSGRDATTLGVDHTEEQPDREMKGQEDGRSEAAAAAGTGGIAGPSPGRAPESSQWAASGAAPLVIPGSGVSCPDASAVVGGGVLSLPLTVLHQDRKCPKVLAPRSGRLGDTKHLVLPAEIAQALPRPMRDGQVAIRIRAVLLPQKARRRVSRSYTPIRCTTSRGSDNEFGDDTSSGSSYEHAQEEQNQEYGGGANLAMCKRGGFIIEEVMCMMGCGPGGKPALQIVVSELMFGRPTESFRLLPDFTLELGLGHRTMRLPIKRSATTRSELPPQATSARPGMAATIVTVTGAVPTSGATVGTCGTAPAASGATGAPAAAEIAAVAMDTSGGGDGVGGGSSAEGLRGRHPGFDEGQESASRGSAPAEALALEARCTEMDTAAAATAAAAGLGRSKEDVACHDERSQRSAEPQGEASRTLLQLPCVQHKRSGRATSLPGGDTSATVVQIPGTDTSRTDNLGLQATEVVGASRPPLQLPLPLPPHYDYYQQQRHAGGHADDQAAMDDGNRHNSLDRMTAEMPYSSARRSAGVNVNSSGGGGPAKWVVIETAPPSQGVIAALAAGSRGSANAHLLPLALRRKYASKQLPVLMRPSSGILGSKKHLPVPPQILELLPADQRSKKPRPVTIRIIHISPPYSSPAAGANEGDGVSYVNWREHCLEEVLCTIGPTGSHGCMSLQLLITAAMWNRPLLFMRLQVDGALELALGDVKSSFPPPREPVNGGGSGTAAAIGGSGEVVGVGRRRMQHFGSLAAVGGEEAGMDSDIVEEGDEEDEPYFDDEGGGSGSGRRGAMKMDVGATAVGIEAEDEQQWGWRGGVKRARWQEGGGDSHSGEEGADVVAAATDTAAVAAVTTRLSAPLAQGGLRRQGSARLALPDGSGGGGGSSAGGVAGGLSLDALASAAAAAAQAEKMTSHRQQQMQQQQQQQRPDLPYMREYDQVDEQQPMDIIEEHLMKQVALRRQQHQQQQQQQQHGRQVAAAAGGPDTGGGGGGGGRLPNRVPERLAAPMGLNRGTAQRGTYLTVNVGDTAEQYDHRLSPVQRPLPSLPSEALGMRYSNASADTAAAGRAPGYGNNSFRFPPGQRCPPYVVQKESQIHTTNELHGSDYDFSEEYDMRSIRVLRKGGDEASGMPSGAMSSAAQSSFPAGRTASVIDHNQPPLPADQAAWGAAIRVPYRLARRPPVRLHESLPAGVQFPLGVLELMQRGRRGAGGGSGPSADEHAVGDYRSDRRWEGGASGPAGRPFSAAAEPVPVHAHHRMNVGMHSCGDELLPVPQEPAMPQPRSPASTLGQTWILLQQVPRAQLSAAKALAAAGGGQGPGGGSGPEGAAALSSVRSCLAGIVLLLTRARDAAAADSEQQQQQQLGAGGQLAQPRYPHTMRCLLAAGPLLLSSTQFLLDWYDLLAKTAANGTAASHAEELSSSVALVRAQLTEALAALPRPPPPPASAIATG